MEQQQKKLGKAICEIFHKLAKKAAVPLPVLWMNGGFADKGPDAYFACSFPGPRDVICRLHPHQRVHLNPESHLNSQRHVAGKGCLEVEETGQGGAGNGQRGGGLRDGEASPLDDLSADEIAGMWRIFNGHNLDS
jgi:hypothetical protein